MIDAQIDRLYQLLQKSMKETELRLLAEFDARLQLRFDGVMTHLDTIRGFLDTDELERTAMQAQLNRHEHRISLLEK